MVVRLPLLLLPLPPTLARSPALPTLLRARPPHWFASSRREGLREEVKGGMGGRLGAGRGGCLRLGVSRSPGNLGIADRKRKLNSCSCLSVEASGLPAFTDTHIRGTYGIGPGTGRCCLGPTALNPEVGARAVSSGRMKGSSRCCGRG